MFEEIGLSANLTESHRLTTAFTESSDAQLFSGGGTTTDLNGDGLLDLYLIGGNGSRNVLYLNQGSMSFAVAQAPTLEIAGVSGSGPIFADIDGDARDDLFVGSVEGDPIHVFKNLGNLQFEDVTSTTGISQLPPNTVSAAFGDIDLDGDLDLFLSHWGAAIEPGLSTAQLWENGSNLQDISFSDISVASGVSAAFHRHPKDYSYTPTFSDINADGLPDLLVASDLSTSKVFINTGTSPGRYRESTPESVRVVAGMGSAVGDYDNDGDMDWFVSAISLRPDSHHVDYRGNALYENVGDGNFLDVTQASGVQKGMWAWGACFADFNNDTALDVFVTNGWPQAHYEYYGRTASHLYISNGDGTFSDKSLENNIVEKSQGRGVICADFDRDGDIDILVANNNSRPLLYENLTTDRFGTSVQLAGLAPNTKGIGAKVVATIDGLSQHREITLGSNYVSNNPAEAHFGIGAARTIDRLEVTWPDGAVSILEDVEASPLLTITHPHLL